MTLTAQSLTTCVLLCLCLQPGKPVSAEPELVRLDEIAFPGEEIQAAARLRGIERSANPRYLPGNVVRLVTQSAVDPLGAVGANVMARNARIDWPNIVREYHRLMYDSGAALAPLPRSRLYSASRSRLVRGLCHRRLAALPPSILRIYQRRVDPLAAKLLHEGKKNRDVRVLQRLVDELFCSRFTDQALGLLGDLAFERGDFDEAREYWSLLVTLPGEDPRGLHYPHPQVDVAQVRGKQILDRLFAGDFLEAERALRAFRKLHADASGHLAGKRGNFLEILTEVTRTSFERRVFAPWPTFAGDFDRNTIAPFTLKASVWSRGPAWKVELPKKQPQGGKGRQASSHAVVFEGMLAVADACSVRLFDCRKGTTLASYCLRDPKEQSSLTERPTYTLSVRGEKIYACLGDPSSLICLDVKRDAGGEIRLHEAWRLDAPKRRNAPGVFEGAPALHDGRAFIAVTYRETGTTRTALACLDASTGRVHWWKEVCTTPSLDVNKPRLSNHLLTLAGTRLVFCTHSGAIVAVDCRTGRTCWAIRYPGRGSHGDLRRFSPRPCVFDEGKLYIAPLDTHRVYCVDSVSGTMLWEREGLRVVDLLGVRRGKLFFTTSSGLRAVNGDSGLDQSGWKQPTYGSLASGGRGLLIGNWILWPTSEPKLPVRAVSQLDGSQKLPLDLANEPPRIFDPTQLRRLRPGNFAAGRHGLIVVDRQNIYGYTPLELPKAGATDEPRVEQAGR